MKCSRRKAPTGTIPVSECKRRNRNEVPCPARRGATPDLSLTGAAVEAKGPLLICSAIRREPFIILSGLRLSQERPKRLDDSEDRRYVEVNTHCRNPLDVPMSVRGVSLKSLRPLRRRTIREICGRLGRDGYGALFLPASALRRSCR